MIKRGKGVEWQGMKFAAMEKMLQREEAGLVEDR